MNHFESLMGRFLKYGSADQRASMDQNMGRVAIAYHAPNHQNAAPEEKTIDYTCMLHDGSWMYIECKMTGSRSLAWNRFSDHQQSMLKYCVAHNGTAAVAIGFYDEVESELLSAWLIPWPWVQWIRHTWLNEGPDDQGKARQWKTVTVERLRYWVPNFELMPLKRSPSGRGKQVELFTKAEINEFEHGKAAPTYPPHLPVPMNLIGFYLQTRKDTY